MGTPRQPADSIPAGPRWATGPCHRFRRCNWLLPPFVPSSRSFRGEVIEKNGAPGLTRTADLLVRSQTLYPTELRALAEEDFLTVPDCGARVQPRAARA